MWLDEYSLFKEKIQVHDDECELVLDRPILEQPEFFHEIKRHQKDVDHQKDYHYYCP